MERETKALTLYLDADVSAFIKDLADSSGTTPDQAASVLAVLSLNNYLGQFLGKPDEVVNTYSVPEIPDRKTCEQIARSFQVGISGRNR